MDPGVDIHDEDPDHSSALSVAVFYRVDASVYTLPRMGVEDDRL